MEKSPCYQWVVIHYKWAIFNSKLLNYQRVSENLIQNLGTTGLDRLISIGEMPHKGRAPWGKLHSKLAALAWKKMM